MKHLQKFESFTNEMINENIFQNAYNKVKSKIAAWKDSNIKEYFNQGINIFQKTKDTTEGKNIIAKLKELPENEKAKLNAFVNDPSGLYKNLVTNQATVTEAVNFDTVKKFLGKLVGGGVFIGSIANYIFSIVSTNFPTSGSAYNFSANGGGLAFATIAMMLGFIVGAMLYIGSSDSKNAEAKTANPAPAPAQAQAQAQ